VAGDHCQESQDRTLLFAFFRYFHFLLHIFLHWLFNIFTIVHGYEEAILHVAFLVFPFFRCFRFYRTFSNSVFSQSTCSQLLIICINFNLFVSAFWCALAAGVEFDQEEFD